jgi:hypothetical protein
MKPTRAYSSHGIHSTLANMARLVLALGCLSLLLTTLRTAAEVRGRKAVGGT